MRYFRSVLVSSDAFKKIIVFAESCWFKKYGGEKNASSACSHKVQLFCGAVYPMLNHRITVTKENLCNKHIWHGINKKSILQRSIGIVCVLCVSPNPYLAMCCCVSAFLYPCVRDYPMRYGPCIWAKQINKLEKTNVQKNENDC